MPKINRILDLEFFRVRNFAEFPLSETPYISAINTEEEYLTIFNPSFEEISLAGYRVEDSRGLHVFHLPKGTIVPPQSNIYVYTCPARAHSTEPFRHPNVLWTNHDGTLRKKEVLKNGIQYIKYSTLRLTEIVCFCRSLHHGSYCTKR
jgi:hypothetical protein